LVEAHACFYRVMCVNISICSCLFSIRVILYVSVDSVIQYSICISLGWYVHSNWTMCEFWYDVCTVCRQDDVCFSVRWCVQSNRVTYLCILKGHVCISTRSTCDSLGQCVHFIKYCVLLIQSCVYFQMVKHLGRFLSGGIILGSPLSCPDLFLYTITLPAVSRDAPATLSYTALEMASRVLLSSKKPAICFDRMMYSMFFNRSIFFSTMCIFLPNCV
jgi:hypothetical protein